MPMDETLKNLHFAASKKVYAKKIVADFFKGKNKMQIRNILLSREHHATEIKKRLILKMHEMGFNCVTIGHAIGKDRTTINHYIRGQH